MRRPSPLLGLVLGGLISLPFLALDYLGRQWAGLPFVPFDLFDWLARVLPGRVISVGIDVMVRVIRLFGLGPIDAAAKRMEQLLGILIVVLGGAAIGLATALIVRQTGWPGRNVGAVAGLAAFLLVVAVEASLGTWAAANRAAAFLWLAVLILGWGTALGAWLDAKELRETGPAVLEELHASRRALLLKLAGGSIGAALAAWGLGRFVMRPQQAAGAGQALSRPGATGAAKGGGGMAPAGQGGSAAMRERVAPAPGTRPELTPNRDFYRIDIDTQPPVIDRDAWVLEVSGLFERPRPLGYADILAFPALTQPITLSCISNPIGGDLISTSNWTGVRLRVVLRALGLKPEARGLLIQAADGFYESLALEDMLDPRTLLVYGMNGETLPTEHGFPLRVYVPNRYGMKQPKWITRIEAVDRPDSGYWVDRGWSAEARPRIVSVIDTVATDHIRNGRVPTGGIAWAGDRGIRSVEVRVDGGAWVEAVLRTPPLSPLTWVQWRYDWPAVPGRHTLRVRATDGAGARQIEAEHDPYPDGATGYHSVTLKI